MTVKIIKNYIILLVVFFSWVNLAHAGLEITEIMYNSKGADIDWVEIYNPDNKNEDVTKIKLLISNSESNHGIIGYNGSQYLKQGEYGIIVVGSQMSGFNSKWANIKNLFTSSFSLPNLKDGENALIEINYGDKLSPIDSVSYDNSKGASDDGNSLQLIGSKWEESSPTPGSGNQGVDNTNSVEESISEDNTVDETADPTPIPKDNPEILKITTKIIPPKIITAGIPFMLSSLTTTNRGETYTVGNFVWNFGDGMVRKVRDSSPFEYAYEYPGEYALTLSYFSSTFSQIADATNRITIKVIPSEIFISSVGSASDPFIEIENKSSNEIILSNWIVTAGTHYFIIPEGTTLLPNKKIKLSPKITGFVGGDINSVIITDPSKEITATYPTETKKLVPKVLSVSKTTSYVNPVSSDNSSPDDSLPQDSQVINLNDLGASTGESGSNIPKSIYPIIGLLAVIGIGVTSFLLIKKKNNVEDYVEKGIRAEDMTIIE